MKYQTDYLTATFYTTAKKRRPKKQIKCLISAWVHIFYCLHFIFSEHTVSWDPNGCSQRLPRIPQAKPQLTQSRADARPALKEKQEFGTSPSPFPPEGRRMSRAWSFCQIKELLWWRSCSGYVPFRREQATQISYSRNNHTSSKWMSILHFFPAINFRSSESIKCYFQYHCSILNRWSFLLW